MARALAATPFNGLTPAEAERLALLLEELGEAQQAIGKILRHGYERYNPDLDGGPTNRVALTVELGDVLAAMKMLAAKRDIPWKIVAGRASFKRLKVKKYLHHQQREADRG